MVINFKKIEKKWQDKWEKKRIFEVKEEKGKKKYYVLEMFPYPSGEGLHMGHAFNYILGDIYARFKRMSGFNVLYPMGYDSLGLPAENAAIKAGQHPKKFTEKAINNFIKQQKALGLSYGWSRKVVTYEPDYYKWDQWIFLQMFKKGLAFRKKASVNYCKKCKTVLANEQVHDGKCWRHKDTDVEIKHLEQWFLKITVYAPELYNNLDKLKGWPEDIKAMQKNWIGESFGVEINFEIENKNISNCIIVHGSPSRDKREDEDYVPENNKHWIPWLRKNLEKRKINVETPLMPAPWRPDYNEWKKEFEKLSINENSILIGHSAGGAFLVRWLGETKKKIKKLILVSASKENSKTSKRIKELCKFNIGNKIKELVGEIIVFTSDDEPSYRKENAAVYGEKLNGKLIMLKGKGHFCKGDGVTEFPELFDEILYQKWPIFTTRPDTIFGVTFMVISAQHPRLMELVTEEQKKSVAEFLQKIKSTSEKDLEELEKEGAFTGSYAINPFNGEKVPVYVGNFVVADYGSGMVMAVPGHDQRDYEFAKKYKLPVKEVIKGGDIKERAYTDEGVLINSGKFSGLDSEKAIEKISDYIEKKKLGKRSIQYRLKDWLISRQRYWGTPIPIIYCDKCGIVPVSENQLPVKLPEKVKFGKGNPLALSKDFVNVKCPKCGKQGRRETDTMDTFVNSSWYFLRYCDSKNNNQIFDKKKTAYWMPIDQYIGGKEHACMHLIYFRFYTKFLRDIGLLKINEPALKLFNQGMVCGPDGSVMSKSKGNVINPTDMISKYGADVLRLYLISAAGPDKDFIWNDKGIQGSYKFVNKIIGLFDKLKIGKSSKKIESKVNKAVKEISEGIDKFRYSLAIIKLRELFESFENEIGKKDAESCLRLLHPFCPHITEELWEKFGHKDFISLSEWPKADEKKINRKFEEQDKSMGKLKEDINNIIRIVEGRGEKKEKIYVYCLPKEKEVYDEKLISEKIGKQVRIYAVNDKEKYDPTNKSKNSKPGKPAIYLE